MNGRRMQTYLAAGLLMLSGCGGLPMFASKPAPSPTLNILPSFYKANPAVPEQPAVYKTIDACYSLVDWKDFASTQNDYFKKGYELLGHCDFPESTGTPLRDNAIDYGRYLGADVIIYSVQQTPGGESEHHIAYLVSSFAKSRGLKRLLPPTRFPNRSSRPFLHLYYYPEIRL